MRIHRFREKLWTSLLWVAIAAGVFPLLAPLLTVGRLRLDEASTANTLIASLAAGVAALLLFRRIISYPGTRAFGFIVPAFSCTFGFTAAILLFARADYSGSMLLIGYVLSIASTFMLGYFNQRGAPTQMFYVPVGNTGIVDDAPQVEWIRLERPALPDVAGGAIVADLRMSHSPEWERMLAQAALQGIPVYHTKQLRESLTGRVQIEHLSENSFGSLVPTLSYRGIKRTLDLTACLLLLPLLLVLLAVLALLVRFSSPGPILFRQERVGYRGELFTVLKFRTMVQPGAIIEGTSALELAITTNKDARVTKVGRFLRHSRLDELPQVINILRGEMSWIGPRPEAVPLSRWYERELPFYSYRHIVRPGITGWAQVNQGHVAGLDDVHVKLHYDFYYIKFFSFWLDLLIAFRTAVTMISGFGAR